jgi:hypothetical protein
MPPVVKKEKVKKEADEDDEGVGNDNEEVEIDMEKLWGELQEQDRRTGQKFPTPPPGFGDRGNSPRHLSNFFICTPFILLRLYFFFGQCFTKVSSRRIRIGES